MPKILVNITSAVDFTTLFGTGKAKYKNPYKNHRKVTEGITGDKHPATTIKVQINLSECMHACKHAAM